MESAHAFSLDSPLASAEVGLESANSQPSVLESEPLHGLRLLRNDAESDVDATLLDAVSRRAAGSLEQLYSTAGPRLQALAVRLLGSYDDAREAVQDAFVRIWEKAPDFDPSRSRAFTWMAMMLRGICLDILRKRRLRAPVWQDWGNFSNDSETFTIANGRNLQALASPGDDFLTAQVLEDIRHAFDCLPLDDQRLLLASLFSPDELSDIARAVGQPVGTVKSRIHRAMIKLRTLLRWTP